MAPELLDRLSPQPRHLVSGRLLRPHGPVHAPATHAWDSVTRERCVHIAQQQGLDCAADADKAETIFHVSSDMTLADVPGAVSRLPASFAPPAGNQEAYALVVWAEEAHTHIAIAAAHQAGAAMASRTLEQLWSADGMPEVGIVDWPGCPVRGLIEGFYGAPWQPEARESMLRFLGASKFNTFVYGPKDDAYHRGRWRDPYPPELFAHVLRQIAVCREEGLRFVYSLGPGLDIQYSSDADREQILRKYAALFDAGVRDFGLYFDDIPYVFLNERDNAVYGEANPDDIRPLGVAQAEVTRKVFDTLRQWDPRCTLIFCPTEYWGSCESGYVSAVRDGLPPPVDVFYTGPDICSARLETEYTRRVCARFGRPIVFWDNYPVNDAAMTGRLHTNPLRGRSPELFSAARGLICNPMTQCEASKIAVGTIAEYLWRPDAYDPESAHARTLRRLVTGEEAPHVERFGAYMHHCCLHDTEAEPFAQRASALKEARGSDAERQAARQLLEEITALNRTHMALERLSNEALRAEMAPWVRALGGWVQVARGALGLLRTPPERRAAERGELETRLKHMAAIKEETCGGVVADFARWVLEQTE